MPDGARGGKLDGTVVANLSLRGDYRLLEVLLDRPAQPPQPGRFVMLRVSGGIDPLLRRPFGIHDFLPGAAGTRLKILYRVCGRGTSLMAALREGERADILGPLGKGFCPPPGDRRPVIVAGGIGGAPLLYLARRMKEEGLDPLVFAGGNTADDVLGEEQFRALGCDFRVATMDGSCGYSGTVVDCMLKGIGAGDPLAFYACGPWPMLARLARACRENGWPMQATVDAHMACGMGLCLGCAVKGAAQKYLMVCKDGPVFDLEEISWEDPT